VSGFHAFVEELFAGLGPVQVKRFFGGGGIYAGERMFGLVMREVIYLKSDAALGAELEALGGRPFTFQKAGETIETHYWSLPEAALDDPDEAAEWAGRALAVAEAAGPVRSGRKRR
jgi:DNA transformation protein and related proteins